MVNFFNIWFGRVQNQKEFGCMQRRQENWLKYNDFTELKKIASGITQTVRIILLFLSSPSHSVPVRFVSLKNVTLNCTSVLLILLLTS